MKTNLTQMVPVRDNQARADGMINKEQIHKGLAGEKSFTGSFI